MFGGDNTVMKNYITKDLNGVTLMKEILTPREAAEYLSVHVRTIYRLVKNRDIPGRKVGGSWRFKKDALDEWLSLRENPSMKGKT